MQIKFWFDSRVARDIMVCGVYDGNKDFFKCSTMTNDDSPPCVCVCVCLFINGTSSVTLTACRGSAAPKPTRACASVKETHLETSLSIIYEAAKCHYNELWHHPKPRPLSIYSQQCGTPHIRAVRRGGVGGVFPAPLAANYMIRWRRRRQWQVACWTTRTCPPLPTKQRQLLLPLS